MPHTTEIFQLMLDGWNTNYRMNENTDYKLGVLRAMWDFCCYTGYVAGMNKVGALRHEVIRGAKKGEAQ